MDGEMTEVRISPNIERTFDVWGAWWDATGGNSKADMNQIRAWLNLKGERIQVNISGSALKAALADPSWAILRAMNPATLRGLSSYWNADVEMGEEVKDGCAIVFKPGTDPNGGILITNAAEE